MTRAPRLDSDLAGYDVPAAVARGLTWPGVPRQTMFAEAAIAASLEAEAIGIDPRGISFLARHVHSAGLNRAASLPEPLIGPGATELARDWMYAAQGVAESLERDNLFGRWLGVVAVLLESRRRNQVWGSS